MNHMTNADQTRPWTKSKANHGIWSHDENVALSDIAGTVKLLDEPGSGWRIVAISLGHGPRGDRPASPTMIELKSGKYGQFQWRYFIPSVKEAKQIIGNSPALLKFLRTTKEAL